MLYKTTVGEHFKLNNKKIMYIITTCSDNKKNDYH